MGAKFIILTSQLELCGLNCPSDDGRNPDEKEEWLLHTNGVSQLGPENIFLGEKNLYPPCDT